MLANTTSHNPYFLSDTLGREALAVAAASKRIRKKLLAGIWAYFLLLIFEGALRKWFLPSLATPLLVVRDPIALWVVVMAWRNDLLQINAYIRGMLIIGFLGILFALVFGHHNLAVAVYGGRILLIHFPFMFAIGAILTRKDIIAIGKATLWIAILMTILIAIQFYSPQSAWVNLGVGGDTDGAGFSGSGDFMRPPGTFSFTNGVSLFYGFLAPFVIFFWLSSEKVNKLLLLVATIGLLAAIPLSISRGLLFQTVLSIVFAVLIVVRNPKYISKVLVVALAVIVLLTFLSGKEFFQTATAAFSDRFENANEAEGGLVDGVLLDRFLGGMGAALMNISEISLFGLGIGMGTNVGAMLLSGSATFLIAEQEWGRLIGELGPILGLGVIFIRLHLSSKIMMFSYRKLAVGDILPWLLLSVGLIQLAQGGWAQPTSLGFCIISGGFMIASLKGEDAAKTDPIN